MDIESRTFEKNGLTYHVKWVLDENPDLSLLGEYQRDASDYCVDRKEGVLLGGWVDSPDEPCDEGFEDTPEGNEAYDRAYDKWEELNDVWEERHGCEVLATGLSNSYTRNSYQFVGGFQHLPHNPDNWKHVTPERLVIAMEANKAKLSRYEVAEGEDAWRLDVLYSVLDYERMEGYNTGDWHMMGCVVKVWAGGYEVGRDSLWGIESDSSDEHREEVEQGCIAQANREVMDATGKLMDAVIAVETFREGAAV